jgi:Holliday junction resolvase RusA-like endonuclease
MKEIIYGNVPSKSNSYRIGNRMLFKTKELIQYEKDFAKQCIRYRNKGIDTEFEFIIDVYFRTRKSDLDGSFKATLDMLQKVGAIKNDNKCIKIVAQKFIDSKNPRIEFEIKTI